MEENKTSTSDKILWWLASADAQLLEKSIEQRKFSLIGLSIFFTWLFATAAWTYFFFS